MTAGAYGAVQAGSCNTRPLVPEVLAQLAQNRTLAIGKSMP
jgi:hypothetical protein